MLDLSKCSVCTCMNLRKASRAITQYYDRMLQPVGLRATQFTILVIIAKSQPISITNLADMLVMERTTLTRNLNPLQRQKFVLVEPGVDRRTRNLTLLPAGEKVLQKAFPLWQKAQDHFENELAARFDRLIDDLQESVAAAQK